MTADQPEKGNYLPRPPAARTTADFIVVVFVVMVASILVLLTVATVFASLFTDDDVTAYLAIITDLLSSIIAALVGFMAGRGVAKENGKP